MLHRIQSPAPSDSATGVGKGSVQREVPVSWPISRKREYKKRLTVSNNVWLYAPKPLCKRARTELTSSKTSP